MTTKINPLRIDQQELQLAQYIPNHDGHCINLHGHTYIMKGIEIDVDIDAFLDFGKVKQVLKDTFDHAFFVPHRHYAGWDKLRKSIRELGCNLNLVPIPGDNTVEEQWWVIAQTIRNLAPDHIYRIKFLLTEGLHQGVENNWIIREV